MLFLLNVDGETDYSDLVTSIAGSVSQTIARVRFFVHTRPLSALLDDVPVLTSIHNPRRILRRTDEAEGRQREESVGRAQ